MKHLIKGGNTSGCLRVEMDKGEWIKAEKNAMIAMGGNLKLSARIDGGFLRGMARKFSGESFFQQEIRAADGAGWVMLAPVLPGAVVAIDLYGKTGITAEKGAFLAATQDVTISSKIQRLIKGFFGGEGFIVIKISGSGTVFLNSFGAVETITLLEGEEITVDNTHLMAWEDSVRYALGKGGASWTSAVLAGEGFTAKMTGPGRIWIQTRTLTTFCERLGILPQRKKSGNTS